MSIEDAWLRCERQYFVSINYVKLDIPEKKLSKAIETYNKFLQDALLGESPYIAEDLKLTILKREGESNVAKPEDREPGSADIKS